MDKSERYLKTIADELKAIRREMQKANEQNIITVKASELNKENQNTM